MHLGPMVTVVDVHLLVMAWLLLMYLCMDFVLEVFYTLLEFGNHLVEEERITVLVFRYYVYI